MVHGVVVFFFLSHFCFFLFLLQPGYGPCVLGSGSQTAKRQANYFGFLSFVFFFPFSRFGLSIRFRALAYDIRARKEGTDKLETKRESGRLFDSFFWHGFSMNSLVLIWVLACSLIDLHLLIQLVNHVSFFFPSVQFIFHIINTQCTDCSEYPSKRCFRLFSFFPLFALLFGLILLIGSRKIWYQHTFSFFLHVPCRL